MWYDGGSGNGDSGSVLVGSNRVVVGNMGIMG